MKYNTSWSIRHFVEVRLHLLVVVSWLGVALLGQMPESGWGWLSYPPHRVVVMSVGGRNRARGARRSGQGQPADQGWRGQVRTWRLPLLRSLLLLGLWLGSGRAGLVGGLTLAGLVVASQRAGVARADDPAGMAGGRLAAVARAAAGHVELPGVRAEPGVAG